LENLLYEKVGTKINLSVAIKSIQVFHTHTHKHTNKNAEYLFYTTMTKPVMKANVQTRTRKGDVDKHFVYN